MNHAATALALALSFIGGCGSDTTSATDGTTGGGSATDSVDEGTTSNGSATESAEDDGTSTGSGATTVADEGTTAGDGPTDSTGDDCPPDAFVGGGIAMDGWTVGDVCDFVDVCVDPSLAAQLQALMPEVGCFEDPQFCSGLSCGLGSGVVTDEVVADACLALTIDGIDEVRCFVIGP